MITNYLFTCNVCSHSAKHVAFTVDHWFSFFLVLCICHDVQIQIPCFHYRSPSSPLLLHLVLLRNLDELSDHKLLTFHHSYLDNPLVICLHEPELLLMAVKRFPWIRLVEALLYSVIGCSNLTLRPIHFVECYVLWNLNDLIEQIVNIKRNGIQWFVSTFDASYSNIAGMNFILRWLVYVRYQRSMNFVPVHAMKWCKFHWKI